MQRGTRSHLESWVPLSMVADFKPLGDGEFSETLLQEAARLGVDLEIAKARPGVFRRSLDRDPGARQRPPPGGRPLGAPWNYSGHRH